ncbi:MAG: hypothetical protein IIC82_02555 [Chloroflexi bacterium]|nr:hypothetical protein [Chloroflexota bacterium]
MPWALTEVHVEVDFAFLCDYADNAGKLHALGIGFDTLHAPELPATHRVFFAVIRLRFSSGEIGEMTFGLRVIDPDGKQVIDPIDGKIRINEPPDGQTTLHHTIAMAIHGMKLERYGPHAVSWLVGGAEVKRVNFKVSSPPTSS